MSKKLTAASSIGAAALVLSGAAFAAAPANLPDFDNWSVNQGDIQADCQADFSCSGDLADKGFLQRVMHDDINNITYFHTIITEDREVNVDGVDIVATATKNSLDDLTFSDESFVRTGNVNGIRDKQRIFEDRPNDSNGQSTEFRMVTTLNSGSWAGNSLSIDQYLLDKFDNFQTDFIFRQENGATPSEVLAKGIKITAWVPIEGTDDQDFILVDSFGTYTGLETDAFNDTASSNTVPGDSTNSVTLFDQSITWEAGDRVKAIWIGQDLSQIYGQEFGLNVYTKDVGQATEESISAFSLLALDNQAWDSTYWGSEATQGTIENPFPLTNP